MMKPRVTDDRWMDAIYATPDPRALKPTAACPETERLQAAVAAELSAAERREIMSHALECAYCTESWRLVAQLGLKPEVPLSRYVVAVLWSDVQRLLELPVLLRRYFADADAGTRRLFTIMSTAVTAAILVVAVRGLWLDAAGDEHGPPATSRGGPELRALPPADGVLPRERFVLRWTGAPAARYDVRITTSAGELVDVATDLAEPRYQVPAERLRNVRQGDLLYYQVSLRLPDEADARTFSVRVE